MKKKVLIIILFILILLCFFVLILGFKNRSENNPELINYKTLEYGKIAYISDYIKDVKKDKKIEYTNLGDFKIEYITSRKKEILNINVVDTTPPVVMLNERLTIVQGSVDNLVEKIMCADNYDKHPKCEIKGEYDLNKVGVYPLTFVAEDSHGNIITIDFELNVIEKTNSSKTSSETNINDIINNHKNEQTKIGIDVSKWQGEIDWNKVKESGIEFAMIRMGTQGGFGKENYVDKYFVTNIENALKENIEVGIYFYSYAITKEEAINQAKYVLEQVKGYDITLPIVFDWESWSSFNNLDLNLYEITQIQEAFLNEIKNAGYKTARYGSKNYLTKVWQESEHLTWLAHYTKNTNYDGEYFMWQLCNNGKVPGINGYVDIDIMYEY